MCALMRPIALLIVFLSLAASAQAVCPPAPVGLNDTVIQMKATGGMAGIGPAGRVVSTTEGAVVYDGTAKTLRLCDGTNWVEMSAGSNTTMTPGWPDAIQCLAGANRVTFYLSNSPNATNLYYYLYPQDGLYLVYNAGGAYQSHGGAATFDCVSAAKSISTLYAEGRAFNFIGGGGNIPAGAVMAFDLATCPAGWSEYAPARGRFLRGIDNGAGNDPDGTRAPGHAQADAFQHHTHNVNFAAATPGNANAYLSPARIIFARQGDGSPSHSESPGSSVASGRVAAETRPKNVAVLYCRKS